MSDCQNPPKATKPVKQSRMAWMPLVVGQTQDGRDVLAMRKDAGKGIVYVRDEHGGLRKMRAEVEKVEERNADEKQQ